MSSSSPNNQQLSVAVVTGSSSGIGLAPSLALAKNGYLTYATMRNLDKQDSIQSIGEKQHLPIRTAEQYACIHPSYEYTILQP
jgi:NAD(P)-dependent dehydrogenase (short-subunit alcohol dehydrogenase family)